MDKFKPTPAKLSTGSFITTLILTVVVIFMESYRKPDYYTNAFSKNIYFACSVSSIFKRSKAIHSLDLVCRMDQANPILRVGESTSKNQTASFAIK